VQSSPSADTNSQLLPIKSQRENKEPDSAPAQDWYNQVEQNDDNGKSSFNNHCPSFTEPMHYKINI